MDPKRALGLLEKKGISFNFTALNYISDTYWRGNGGQIALGGRVKWLDLGDCPVTSHSTGVGNHRDCGL